MTVRELACRLLSPFRRNDPAPDLADEITAHLEMAKADYLRRGMNEAEAERLAAMQFGTVAAAKEQVWEQRQAPGIAALVQDVRYAARGMRKNPGFALVAIATLGLGIGLCSVIYALLSTIVLRPLSGVSDPAQLAVLQAQVPYPWFESYRDQGRKTWSAAAFLGPVPLGVAIDGPGPVQSERLNGILVSPEYFETLRVTPLLGRFFDPHTDAPGAPPSAIVTERFWRTHLHSDPRAIGRMLRVNGHAVPIVGVSGSGFSGAASVSVHPPDVFLAATAQPPVAPELQDDILHRTTRPAFIVLLRLKPGTPLTAAEAQIDARTRVLDTRREHKGRLLRLIPAGTMFPLPNEARAVVLVYYIVLVAVILGLTSANLGGLLLARGAARSKEFAIRLSIGAGRWRLIRQLLTESALLAAAGGAAGFVTAFALLRLVVWSNSDQSNSFLDAIAAGPDLRFGLFVFAISSLAAVGFGLMPALALTRPALMSVMKANLVSGLRRHRRFGLRNAFIVCQVAAAMMLALIMGFFVLGAQRGTRTDPGFDPAPLSFFSVDPARDGLTAEESAAALRRLPERLARIPGVQSVSLADRPPLTGTFPETTVTVPPRAGRSGETTHGVVLEKVGAHFFTTLHATLLRGTDFQDRQAGPVLPAVLNQAAASALFGDADPLGRTVRSGDQTFQVAAVVRYQRPALMFTSPIPTVFVPLTRTDLEGRAGEGVTVLLRASSPVSIAALRKELTALDARLTLFHPKTMRAAQAELERQGNFMAASYLPIGFFGLILASLGLAGVTAQTVERRRKEIGIRMALGAKRAGLLRLVVGEGAVMVLTGAAIGFVAASGLVRVICAVSSEMAQILGPAVSHPALTLGIPALLISLAAISCYVPARRAATVDPLIALREE